MKGVFEKLVFHLNDAMIIDLTNHEIARFDVAMVHSKRMM